MGFGIRLRRLWHLRAGVAISAAFAVFAAVWSIYNISLAPPKLTPRELDMATASTHVVIDTPTSALLDLRQDTYSLEGLTNRAVLLGSVIASASVRQSIAQRAHVPPELLQIDPPLTARQPRPTVDDGNQRHTSDILKSTDQYRLHIQANPTVPLLDIYSQTPDAASAARLANAAVEELRAYLSRLAQTEQTPQTDQIRLVQLGRAHGAVINKSVHWQLALMAFILAFAVSCATVIFLSRVRQGWQQAARAEQTVGA